jgi:hypothetical protein
MGNVHPLRRAYDAAERAIAPRVESVVHSPEFVATARWATDARARFRAGFAQAGEGMWHLVNLPAASDITRLRRQLGALDRDVRHLTLELERLGHGPHERGANHAIDSDSEQLP